MKEIRDPSGKLICCYNASTGVVECLYKKQTLIANLANSTLTIVRDGVTTHIQRKTPSQFSVRFQQDKTV